MSGFRDAGIQRPLNRRLGEVLGGVGVSTLGNTAGTTGTVFGPAVLVGVSGVTLSQSTRGNLATISILASAEAGVAIGAGTQTQATGTVVFSNSNNVTFGLSAGTLTASAGGVAISAGTQAGSTGSIVFADSNGITFGMSGSSQVTASHNGVQSVGAQDFGGGAGLNVGVPRWVWASSAGYNVAFSKSVNGVSGSIVAHAQAVAVADGAGTQTSGTVQFSNANGVSFGLNAGTMTASVDAGMRQISFWDASALKQATGASAQVTRMLFQRINIANPIAATRAQLMMHVSNSNSAGGTIAYSFGVYTMSGSTASLASSASRTWAYNSTLGAGSSYTDIQLTNYRSMTLGTWSLTQGDYLFALQFRLTTALTSGTYSWIGGGDLSIAGFDNGTGPANYFNHGKLDGSTAAFPATLHPSQIKGAQFDDAYFYPYFQLIGTH